MSDGASSFAGRGRCRARLRPHLVAWPCLVLGALSRWVQRAAGFMPAGINPAARSSSLHRALLAQGRPLDRLAVGVEDLEVVDAGRLPVAERPDAFLVP